METYKIIEGFENYSVSDFGNVKKNTTGHIVKQHDENGYKRLNIEVNKKHYKKFLHVLVAGAFIPNPENKPFVDHIDNCKTNNNIQNLRWATRAQNNQNSSIRKDNTSGVKGVYFHKASQKYEARISIDGINVYIGLFTNLEDAKQARITKANQVFGVFTNSCEKII